VGNAFKFVPDGGVVRCALHADGGRARLEVADSGPGVSPERRGVIFERFAQATRGQGGTGLGLAIVRELVRLHGGSIAVGEAPEGGALFTVELPLQAPAGVEVHAAPVVAGPGAAARSALAELTSMPPVAPAAGPDAPRVLVVEDNPEMARFVADALGTEYAITLAADGAQGLERAHALPPD